MCVWELYLSVLEAFKLTTSYFHMLKEDNFKKGPVL